MDVYAAQEGKKERVHDHHWQARTRLSVLTAPALIS